MPEKSYTAGLCGGGKKVQLGEEEKSVGGSRLEGLEFTRFIFLRKRPYKQFWRGRN